MATLNEKPIAAIQELILMRHDIGIVRDRVNKELDGLIGRIDQLLPPQDNAITLRYKNYTKKDWQDFLSF